jgi:hypothetical protein
LPKFTKLAEVEPECDIRLGDSQATARLDPAFILHQEIQRNKAASHIAGDTVFPNEKEGEK